MLGGDFVTIIHVIEISKVFLIARRLINNGVVEGEEDGNEIKITHFIPYSACYAGGAKARHKRKLFKTAQYQYV